MKKLSKEQILMNRSGLTAKEAGQSMTFAEAEVTLVCRKLFAQELKTENMLPEIASTFYSGDAVHDMYIGEIVEIEKK